MVYHFFSIFLNQVEACIYSGWRRTAHIFFSLINEPYSSFLKKTKEFIFLVWKIVQKWCTHLLWPQRWHSGSIKGHAGNWPIRYVPLIYYICAHTKNIFRSKKERRGEERSLSKLGADFIKKRKKGRCVLWCSTEKRHNFPSTLLLIQPKKDIATIYSSLLVSASGGAIFQMRALSLSSSAKKNLLDMIFFYPV